MLTTDLAKAPWYLLGLLGLQGHDHPTLAGVTIPGILVLFLIAIPYLNPARKKPRGKVVSVDQLKAIKAALGALRAGDTLAVQKALEDAEAIGGRAI